MKEGTYVAKHTGKRLKQSELWGFTRGDGYDIVNDIKAELRNDDEVWAVGTSCFCSRGPPESRAVERLICKLPVEYE